MCPIRQELAFSRRRHARSHSFHWPGELSHQVPLPVVQSRPPCHADQDVGFIDLDFGDAAVQRQDKPLIAAVVVPVEDHALRVEGPELESRLDAAKMLKHEVICMN